MSQQTHDDTKHDQDGPPSLADVVRQATDNGLVIANFYSDVIQGKLDDEGFEACHKMEAAMQVHAIAPDVVADAIERLTGVECHPERRGKRPKQPNRSSRQANRSSTKDLACPVHHAGNPYPVAGRQALEYLADALAAPSLVDDPRVAGIVRGSTDHGKSVVSFLLHVMYGNMRGFRPNNRMEAANELIGHIARDELRTQGDLSVVPAKAGTQRGGADEGLPSHVPEPQSVRPEPVEEPTLSLPKGQCSDNASAEDASQDPSPSAPSASSAVETHRGTYDIDRKLAEAQFDPDHPVHKFVEAYEEVAETFRRQDEDNDNDEDVRRWISGEGRDSYGRHIWQYAPANPSVERLLNPKKRRRQRSKPKTESIWGRPQIADRIRAKEGTYPPKRTLIWI